MSEHKRRRKSVASKVKSMNHNFELHREDYFTAIMHRLQNKLHSLHEGTDPEYLERLTDLKEARDYRLTELFLWEQYQIEQAQKQYQRETKNVIESHENMMGVIKQKLKMRLENQRKRLAEDRALLNVSSDHSFFQLASNPLIPTTRSAAVAALSGNDRRTLRRRDVNLNSDMSGTESSRRRHSDDSGMSGAERMDLDLLREMDQPRGRGSGKTYTGVKVLRNEEGMSDLAEIAQRCEQLRK